MKKSNQKNAVQQDECSTDKEEILKKWFLHCLSMLHDFLQDLIIITTTITIIIGIIFILKMINYLRLIYLFLYHYFNLVRLYHNCYCYNLIEINYSVMQALSIFIFIVIFNWSVSIILFKKMLKNKLSLLSSFSLITQLCKLCTMKMIASGAP